MPSHQESTPESDSSLLDKAFQALEEAYSRCVKNYRSHGPGNIEALLALELYQQLDQAANNPSAVSEEQLSAIGALVQVMSKGEHFVLTDTMGSFLEAISKTLSSIRSRLQSTFSIEY